MKYFDGQTKEELMEEAIKFAENKKAYDAEADKYWKDFKSTLKNSAFKLVAYYLPSMVVVFVAFTFWKDMPRAIELGIWAAWIALIISIIKPLATDKNNQLMSQEEAKSNYAVELKRYLKVIEMSEALLNDPEFKQIEHLLPKYDIESFDGLYDRKAVKNTLIFMNKKFKEAQGIKNSGALTASVDLISGLTDLSEFRDVFVSYVDSMLEEDKSIRNVPGIATYQTLDKGFQYKKTLKI